MEKLKHKLAETGIRPETIEQIAEFVGEPPAGSVDKDDFHSADDRTMLLNTLIVLSFDLPTFTEPVLLLLSKLMRDEGSLSDYDKGRLFHVKGFLEWKLNNAVYAACHSLNRSIEHLTASDYANSAFYLARVHDVYGQILKSEGLLNDARDEYEISLSLREHSGDLYGKAITLGNLGRLNADLGNFKNAIEYLTQDLNIVRYEFENKNLEAQLLNTIALCLIETGDFERAEEYIRSSMELNSELNNPAGQCLNYITLLTWHLRLCNVPLASDCLTEINTLLNLEKIPAYLLHHIEAEKLKLTAELNFQIDHFAEAEKLYQAAVELYLGSSSFSPVETAKLLYDYGQVLYKLENKPKAFYYYRQSLQQLDMTEAHGLRRRIERQLMTLNRDSWVLHTAGRFIGHHQIDGLLDETGKEGFRGEHRHAAILFSDISDFTSISEKFDPKELISFLNDFFRLMTRSIELYDGYVDKFIGDAIMAVFVAKDDSPQELMKVTNNACMGALMMLTELQRFNRKRAEGVPEIRISTGIHAGEAIAGLIGSPRKRSYTFMGDTVNTASRIEGIAKMMGASVALTEDVYKKLEPKHNFLLRPLGKYKPKGKERALNIVELIGLDDESFSSTEVKQEIEDATRHLTSFQKRDFDEAGNGFEKLYQQCSHLHRSKGYAFLATQSRNLKKDPPHENWDGDIRLISK